MPSLLKTNLKNNIINRVARINPRRDLDNKTMKREFVFPLVVGVILGAMIMILWQFNARLNNVGSVLTQLETMSTNNATQLQQVTAFIQQVTQQNQGAAPTTPTTPAN